MPEVTLVNTSAVQERGSRLGVLDGTGDADHIAPMGRPSQTADHRVRHMERPVRGDTHTGCGGRVKETD